MASKIIIIIVILLSGVFAGLNLQNIPFGYFTEYGVQWGKIVGALLYAIAYGFLARFGWRLLDGDSHTNETPARDGR